MQVGESIAIPVPHQVGMNDDCPFCPIEKGKQYKTYKGSDNKSETLEKIMEKPANLNQHQANAWPHDGKVHSSREDIESRYKHPTYGFYEFQAHHLISGKQALQGHKVEQWIDKSQGKIEEDTGYTVNGSLNGIWAPSWPKEFRSGAFEGQWTTGEVDIQEVADHVMKAAKCQFHLGAHNIGDPLDPGQTKHMRYDNWLKKQLTQINLRMWGWSRKCPLCSENGERKKPPFQPNEKINKALNKLSYHAQEQLTAPRKMWFIFLSRLALNYHAQVCDHPIPGRKADSK
ncbi:AHH domain-containing protein [Cellvibrio sp. PSBB006]|uniref:AHH domain-containing protein n=1 Tax=Cellvibrio sp. PSBB006 TaxID=1987723 RepID=UPI000B3B8D29|nr:AHH domain-containing protein [Cellvibrio sp. PSBB006]ARU26088.1 hypothetical protein CBR65_00805 [Cellvibrio sp. PSBB006]